MKFNGEHLTDEHLWQYLINQDLYFVQEFGLGIVGIGALMWAYGSVPTSYLREIISWIGLGGSLIIWVHMFGAGKEFRAISEEIKRNNELFFKRFEEARSWRKTGKYIFLYQPVTRLMTYFMGLVSWAWLTIILLNRGVPLESLLNLTWVILVFTLALIIYRKYKDVSTS